MRDGKQHGAVLQRHRCHCGNDMQDRQLCGFGLLVLPERVAQLVSLLMLLQHRGQHGRALRHGIEDGRRLLVRQLGLRLVHLLVGAKRRTAAEQKDGG